MNRWEGLPLLFVSALAFGAEPFTGNAPMICMPQHGHDCLPAEKSCKPLQPEPGKDMNLFFNIQSMSVKTPYRYDTLPISTFAYNEKSLVLQGTSLQLVWSATIHRTTGRLTVAITDREGAYVIFGQCKLADAADEPVRQKPGS
jgi:uncharacterized cupin superfamily protein